MKVLIGLILVGLLFGCDKPSENNAQSSNATSSNSTDRAKSATENKTAATKPDTKSASHVGEDKTASTNESTKSDKTAGEDKTAASSTNTTSNNAENDSKTAAANNSSSSDKNAGDNKTATTNDNTKSGDSSNENKTAATDNSASEKNANTAGSEKASTALKESEGEASYYNDSLNGHKTASGEPYDKNKLTAAHRTLPFGSKVKVTLVGSDKSVVVTINDRGPHDPKHIIDLSGAAAKKIGLEAKGVAQVKLELVK